MLYTIDAKNQKLGRLASKIAQILQGKSSPNYEQRSAGSDSVVVKNASKIVVSGRKATQKVYYRHTGYIGHLKKQLYKDAFAKSPEKVLYSAVKRMLPKNWLAQKRLNKLTIEK